MCIPVFSPRIYSRCVVSPTSPQSRRTPVWKHDSCAPSRDNSYLLFIVTGSGITTGIGGHLARHRHSKAEWRFPFANSSSPLSCAWSSETFRRFLLRGADTCSRGAGNSRELSPPLPSPLPGSWGPCHPPSQLPLGWKPWLKNQTASRLAHSRILSLYSLGMEWGKSGETRVKMQICYNRQLHRSKWAWITLLLDFLPH